MKIQRGIIHIIDDDEITIKVLSHTLGHKGYTVSYSMTGETALEHIEGNVPDLILLDINMPGMDGYDVCRLLKKDTRWQHIPVIFITSSHQTSELIMGFEAGAVDFISKPFNLPELLVRVNTHLELKIARDLIQEKNKALGNEIESRRQAEEKFRALSETAFEAVLFLNRNRIIEFNKAALELFGEKLEKRTKVSVLSFTDEPGATMLKKILRNKDKNGPWEMIFFREKHQPFYGLVQYQTLQYKGSLVHVLAIRDITRQKEMDKEIFTAILEAEEKERKRFSRDMHDGLGALLSTLKIYINLLQKDNKSQQEKADLLEEMKETVSRAVESARTIANNIMPSVLMDHGLIKALKAFTDALNKTGVITIEFKNPENPFAVDANTESHIYRITLELINNTLKHARATHIQLKIFAIDNKIKLDYQDNGIGFEFDKVYTRGANSQGLKNIISRVNFLNGSSQFFSDTGHGFNFQLSIPL